MSDQKLTNMRVAVLATDGFEELELTSPVEALKAAGAHVDVISLKAGSIQGVQHDVKGKKVDVDRAISTVKPEDYDALVLPGGAMNADAMRTDPDVKKFISHIDSANKPIAFICHAPWELISANCVEGRTMTGYHTIQDDVVNAGANWVDHEVVRDRNWVSSRQPSDLPAFNREMIDLFHCSHSSANSQTAKN
jgi:protease I